MWGSWCPRLVTRLQWRIGKVERTFLFSLYQKNSPAFPPSSLPKLTFHSMMWIVFCWLLTIPLLPLPSIFTNHFPSPLSSIFFPFLSMMGISSFDSSTCWNYLHISFTVKLFWKLFILTSLLSGFPCNLASPLTIWYSICPQ